MSSSGRIRREPVNDCDVVVDMAEKMSVSTIVMLALMMPLNKANQWEGNFESRGTC